MVSGPRVFTADTTGVVVALALEDGSEQWRFDTGDGITASPAIAGGWLVIGNVAGAVYGFHSPKAKK